MGGFSCGSLVTWMQDGILTTWSQHSCPNNPSFNLSLVSNPQFIILKLVQLFLVRFWYGNDLPWRCSIKKWWLHFVGAQEEPSSQLLERPCYLSAALLGGNFCLWYHLGSPTTGRAVVKLRKFLLGEAKYFELLPLKSRNTTWSSFIFWKIAGHFQC